MYLLLVASKFRKIVASSAAEAEYEEVTEVSKEMV